MASFTGATLQTNITAGGNETPIDGTFDIDCVAGDTLQMFAFQNTGGALSLTTTATQNWVSYKRIGN